MTFALPSLANHEPRRPRAEDPDPVRAALDARISAAEIVVIYRAAEADIRLGWSLVAGALDNLTTRVAGRNAIRLYDRSHHRPFDFGDLDASLVHLRREIWRSLIERTQVRKIMSVKAWKILEDQVEHGEPPDITEQNLEGLILKLQADGPKMLEDAVAEVFSFLRPRSNDFKTNTQFELGERVVLAGWIESGQYVSSWGLSHYYEQEAVALDNVFRLLDGKVRRADDTYWSDLHNAIKVIPRDKPCHGDTDYFAFKGHKKGTLHLRFKRLDLVRRLNVIAGGARLKPVGAL